MRPQSTANATMARSGMIASAVSTSALPWRAFGRREKRSVFDVRAMVLPPVLSDRERIRQLGNLRVAETRGFASRPHDRFALIELLNECVTFRGLSNTISYASTLRWCNA